LPQIGRMRKPHYRAGPARRGSRRGQARWRAGGALPEAAYVAGAAGLWAGALELLGTEAFDKSLEGGLQRRECLGAGRGHRHHAGIARRDIGAFGLAFGDRHQGFTRRCEFGLGGKGFAFEGFKQCRLRGGQFKTMGEPHCGNIDRLGAVCADEFGEDAVPPHMLAAIGAEGARMAAFDALEAEAGPARTIASPLCVGRGERCCAEGGCEAGDEGCS
jgi:hypothetical protein